MEYLCGRIFHIPVNCDTETLVWFIGAKDTEIEHSEAAKIPFVGIVVFYHHLAGKFLFHGFDEQVAKRRGLFQNKQIFFTHSAY